MLRSLGLSVLGRPFWDTRNVIERTRSRRSVRRVGNASRDRNGTASPNLAPRFDGGLGAVSTVAGMDITNTATGTYATDNDVIVAMADHALAPVAAHADGSEAITDGTALARARPTLCFATPTRRGCSPWTRHPPLRQGRTIAAGDTIDL